MKTSNNILKTAIGLLTRQIWNIGFVDNSVEDIISGEGKLKVRWLNHNYNDRWFADPFILEVTDKDVIVLVEEFYYPDNKGRIAKLTIDKKSFELKETVPLLELKTHLSFPAILRKDGKTYIYPENSESGKVEVYELIEDNTICKKVGVLCEYPLTDAILTELLGKPQIFSTQASDPNGKVISIFEKNAEQKFINIGGVNFSHNIARNAGDWFKYEGDVYRPAQECDVCYGHGISLQKVTTKGDAVEFEEIRHMVSPNNKLKLAFHTFNVYKDVIVVDVCGYKYGKVAEFLMELMKIKKSLRYYLP